MPSQYKLVRSHDPAQFLRTTGPFLYANEAEYSLVLGLAEGLSQGHIQPEWAPQLLHLEMSREVVGVALRIDPRRTAVTRWPELALPQLAKDLSELEPHTRNITGPTETLGELVKLYESQVGRQARVGMAQKILRLTKLNPPKSIAGELHLANAKDVVTVTNWLADFVKEAVPDDAMEISRIRLIAEDRIARQQVYLWRMSGKPVAMTHVGRPTKNGISVNAVYTPKNLRGRGYASKLVGDVSERMLRQYQFCVLYTDAKNPTSNKIYQSLGYEIIADSMLYAFD